MNPKNSPINELLNTTPQLWKGRRPNHSQHTLSTGHTRLNDRLPGGGWPLGAVTELISGKPGLGELSLLFPALAAQGERGHWLVLVDPPWIPYPAALHGHGLALGRLLLVRSRSAKESLWACEQALKGSQGGAVLAWPENISFTRLRRLQLAAEAGTKTAFLFRPEAAAGASSPAALRLQLHSDEYGTRVDVLKCRGSRPLEPAWIPQPYPLSRPRHTAAAQPSNIMPQPSTGTVQLPVSTTLN
jgi:cell division inhibitor SulA/protein ImuA